MSVHAIDVRDLTRAPGASRTVTVDEPVGEDLRLELASIRGDQPVHAELLLESVVEGILASGPVSGTMTLRCSRCLKTFEQPLEVEVQELFARNASPDGDEYPIAPEGAIDPEPMIRDALVLAMPFSPVCRPDCKGLCDRCGGDRNLDECACAPLEVDTRWAALDAIRFDPEDGEAVTT